MQNFLDSFDSGRNEAAIRPQFGSDNHEKRAESPLHPAAPQNEESLSTIPNSFTGLHAPACRLGFAAL